MEEEENQVFRRITRGSLSSVNPVLNIEDKSKAQYKMISMILKKEELIRTPDEKLLLLKYSEIVDIIEKRVKANQNAKEHEMEIEDSSKELEVKCENLAKIIKKSRSLIVYTGAGISTAASIPDYRGPNGVWTLLKKGKQCSTPDLSTIEPTYTHMAIAELYKQGYLKYVTSQNCDGLHLRSGLPQTHISELHGNMYIERCPSCTQDKKKISDYIRLFDVTEKTAQRRHKTGRSCKICRGPLFDTIVHFGEKSGFHSPHNWKKAISASNRADVILCLGSSLKVLKQYSCLWATHKLASRRPKLIIINLQWTPKDRISKIKINAKCDEAMKLLMKNLNLNVPVYDKYLDPIFQLATPLKKTELNSTTRQLLIKTGQSTFNNETIINEENLNEPIKRKRGRPFSKVKINSSQNQSSNVCLEGTVKRKRGRPFLKFKTDNPKNPSFNIGIDNSIKRKRGRPFSSFKRNIIPNTSFNSLEIKDNHLMCNHALTLEHSSNFDKKHMGDETVDLNKLVISTKQTYMKMNECNSINNNKLSTCAGNNDSKFNGNNSSKKDNMIEKDSMNIKNNVLSNLKTDCKSSYLFQDTTKEGFTMYNDLKFEISANAEVNNSIFSNSLVNCSRNNSLFTNIFDETCEVVQEIFLEILCYNETITQRPLFEKSNKVNFEVKMEDSSIYNQKENVNGSKIKFPCNEMFLKDINIPIITNNNNKNFTKTINNNLDTNLNVFPIDNHRHLCENNTGSNIFDKSTSDLNDELTTKCLQPFLHKKFSYPNIIEDSVKNSITYNLKNKCLISEYSNSSLIVDSINIFKEQNPELKNNNKPYFSENSTSCFKSNDNVSNANISFCDDPNLNKDIQTNLETSSNTMSNQNKEMILSPCLNKSLCNKDNNSTMDSSNCVEAQSYLLSQNSLTLERDNFCLNKKIIENFDLPITSESLNDSYSNSNNFRIKSFSDNLLVDGVISNNSNNSNNELIKNSAKLSFCNNDNLNYELKGFRNLENSSLYKSNTPRKRNISSLEKVSQINNINTNIEIEIKKRLVIQEGIFFQNSAINDKLNNTKIITNNFDNQDIFVNYTKDQKMISNEVLVNTNESKISNKNNEKYIKTVDKKTILDRNKIVPGWFGKGMKKCIRKKKVRSYDF